MRSSTHFNHSAMHTGLECCISHESNTLVGSQAVKVKSTRNCKNNPYTDVFLHDPAQVIARVHSSSLGLHILNQNFK